MDRLERVKSKLQDPGTGKELDDSRILESLLRQKLVTDKEVEEYLKDSSFGLKAVTKEEKILAKVKLAIAYTQLYANNRAGISDYLKGDRQKWEELLGGREFVIGSSVDVNNIVFKEREDRSPEEVEDAALDAYVANLFELAQTFVRAKRTRLRTAIYVILRLEIAAQLLEPERDSKGYNTAPYLRDHLKARGFRLNAKTMNKTDRDSLDKTTEAVLLFLEDQYLSREAGKRYELFMKWQNSDTDEGFIFSDCLDEFIANFSIYDALETLFKEAFFGGDVSLILDLIKGYYGFNVEDSETLPDELKEKLKEESRNFFDLFAGTKFEYLLNEEF